MSQQISWERIENFQLQPRYCVGFLLDCHSYNFLHIYFFFFFFCFGVGGLVVAFMHVLMSETTTTTIEAKFPMGWLVGYGSLID